MAKTQDIPALLASQEDYESLSSEAKKRLHLMVDHVEEAVGVDHLIHALGNGTSHSGDDVVRCYVGFEPSGKGPHRMESAFAPTPTNA